MRSSGRGKRGECQLIDEIALFLRGAAPAAHELGVAKAPRFL
jgi:hypothetical protein